MIGDNKTNFSHKLLLTNRQVSNFCKAFANHLSADIKLPKTQLSKMIQSGGFLGRLPLIKNVIKPLAKKCFNSFSINCSSISSRCMNT